MTINVHMNDGVAHIFMHFPPHNLLSNFAKSEITDTIKDVSHERGVRVIVFGSIGDNFSLGADLKEFPARIQNGNAREVWKQGHNMLQALMDCPQPTICCIAGKAFGAGAEFMSAFDIRILADNSTIAYPETHRGVFPGNGGLERLVDLVGVGKAMELIIRGESIDAHEALRIGLATAVVPTPDIRTYSETIARQLANRSNVALRLAKQAIKAYYSVRDQDFRTGMELFAEAHETYDVKEAVSAFLEKRSPQFRHR